MNVLMTGGSSGLGRAIVENIARNGIHKIYFTYNRHEEEALEIKSGRDSIVPIKCDFRNGDDVARLVDLIPGFDLDVLINNAYVGSAQGKHFHKTADADFLMSFQDNIVPTVRISQSAIRCFREKKFGKIISVLTAYLVNLPPIGVSIYTANKAYLQQLSKSWNAEYAGYNITSNCISPDFMQTNLSADVDDRIIEQMKSAHPLKKILTPDEVAEAVSFLVNASQQVNGANLIINSAKNVV